MSNEKESVSELNEKEKSKNDHDFFEKIQFSGVDLSGEKYSFFIFSHENPVPRR
jgi:hypothetical protein